MIFYCFEWVIKIIDHLCFSDDKGIKILSVDPSTYKFLEEKRIKEEEAEKSGKSEPTTTEEKEKATVEESEEKKDEETTDDSKTKDSKL